MPRISLDYPADLPEGEEWNLPTKAAGKGFRRLCIFLTLPLHAHVQISQGYFIPTYASATGTMRHWLFLGASGQMRSMATATPVWRRER